MKIAPSYYFGSILFLAEALAEESIQKKEQAEPSQFLFTAQLSRKTNLAEIFSEARSGTIAHKNKKRRKISQNTSVYSMSLLPCGHTYFPFYFTHTYKY
jgi:hypothetical protein